MKKLEYCGVRGIPNKWFASHLSNKKQFISLNGYKSNLADVSFLIYISDLHLAITYYEVHHFAHDTNPLNLNNSVKSINKQINHDLLATNCLRVYLTILWSWRLKGKILAYWLKKNNISLNFDKTELMLFTSPKKQLDSNLKTKLNGKKLYETDSKIWESELIKLDLETTG